MRELKQDSALYLLYGDTGVGKTRLLRELSQNRLAKWKIHWLDFASGDAADGVLPDYSRAIEELFETAGSGDIIVIDHFEEALKKNLHQLFLSWSTDGMDHKLNMIIASSNDGFNELRQLAQHYQMPVQSFQLMPYSSHEVEAFLQYYLFSGQSDAKLEVPAPLRKQLMATQGVVGRVIEVVERDGKLIKSALAVESGSTQRGGRIFAAVMVLLACAAIAGWYLLGRPGAEVDLMAGFAPEPAVVSQVQERESVEIANTTTSTEKNSPPVVAGTEKSPGPWTNAPEQEADQAAVVPTVADDAVDEASAFEKDPQARGEARSVEQQKLPAGQSVVSAKSQAIEETVAPVKAQTQPVDEPESGYSLNLTLTVDAGAGNQDVAAAAIETRATGQPVSIRDRFGLDLRRSQKWIAERDNRVGTIQIMLLKFDNFDIKAYYKYIGRLENKQIDIEQVRVFKTLTGNNEVYSVFYGEYDTRPAATREIRNLPDVLRDSSPMARSVGGILEEIGQLSAKN